MTAFLLWILSLVLVWNVVPHLFLWSLKGVEVEQTPGLKIVSGRQLEGPCSASV